MLSDVSSVLSSKSKKDSKGIGGGSGGRGVMVKSISESSSSGSDEEFFSGRGVETPETSFSQSRKLSSVSNDGDEGWEDGACCGAVIRKVISSSSPPRSRVLKSVLISDSKE